MALTPSEHVDEQISYSNTSSITASTTAEYKSIKSTTITKSGTYIIIGNTYSNFNDVSAPCVSQVFLNNSQIAIARGTYVFGGGANAVVIAQVPANATLEIRGWDPGNHSGSVIYGVLNYYRLGD